MKNKNYKMLDSEIYSLGEPPSSGSFSLIYVESWLYIIIKHWVADLGVGSKG